MRPTLLVDFKRLSGWPSASGSLNGAAGHRGGRKVNISAVPLGGSSGMSHYMVLAVCGKDNTSEDN